MARTGEYTGEKSGGRKRKSPGTKNGVTRETVKRHIQNQAEFRDILADSRYASAGNMRFIAKREKVFIFEPQGNRRVTDSESKRNRENPGGLCD
jgi:hypothetical protein